MANGKSKITRKLSLTALVVLALSQGVTVWADAPVLSLDDSVALTLKNQTAVKLAVEDQSKAKFGIDEAEAGKLPQISLSSSGTHGPAGQGLADNFSTGLHMSWPIYSGGRLEGQVKQAKLTASSADLGVAAALDGARLTATTKYFTVLQTKNLVAVNQEAVDNLTGHLNTVTAQFNAGTVAKGDVLRSQVELANAQQNLTKAENAYQMAQVDLNNTMGVTLSESYTYQEELTRNDFPYSLDESIQMALQNRPELGQAKLAVETANTGVDVAASGHAPTISITGSDGWSGQSFPGSSNNWSVGVSASWNLFDAGATKAKVAEAKTAVNKAADNQKQMESSVEMEVRQNYSTMTEAGKRIDTAQTAVDQAEEALRIASVKYNAGAGTNLDVIDAQLALTQAKTNYTQALFDYNVAQAGLRKAIGGQ